MTTDSRASSDLAVTYVVYEVQAKSISGRIRVKALFLSFALAVGGTALIASPAAAASEDAAKSIRIISANIQGDDAVDASAVVRAQVTQFDPDVVTLQEVCRTEYDRLRALYPSYYFTQLTVKRPATQSPAPCTANGHSGDKGEMIMSRYPITNTWIKDLPGNSQEVTPRIYKLTCIELETPASMDDSKGRNPRSCTAHLAAGTSTDAVEARKQQMGVITGGDGTWTGLNGWVRDNGLYVTLSGDFNVAPMSAVIDMVHRVSQQNTYPTSAKFWEGDQQYSCTDVCRGGAPTLQSATNKYDYVFFSHNAVGRCKLSLATIAQTGISDHLLVRAWGNLNSTDANC